LLSSSSSLAPPPTSWRAEKKACIGTTRLSTGRQREDHHQEGVAAGLALGRAGDEPAEHAHRQQREHEHREEGAPVQHLLHVARQDGVHPVAQGQALAGLDHCSSPRVVRRKISSRPDSTSRTSTSASPAAAARATRAEKLLLVAGEVEGHAQLAPLHGLHLRLREQEQLGGVGGAEHAQLDAQVLVQALADLADAAEGHALAALDDDDRIADLGQLGQDVARDEHRLAARGELAHELAELDARPRVEARRRLVEDQQRRVVEQRLGQVQPLAHALAQARGRPVEEAVEAAEGGQRVDAARARRAAQAVGPREEVEELARAQVRVGRELVGHEADALAHRSRLLEHRDALEQRVARVGQVERGQDAHRRRLARAVGPDEAIDHPRPHLERERVDRAQLAEAPAERAHLEQGLTQAGPPARGGRRRGARSTPSAPSGPGRRRRDRPPRSPGSCPAAAPRSRSRPPSRAGRAASASRAPATGYSRRARGRRRPRRSRSTRPR
jgi:hypothetical protein